MRLFPTKRKKLSTVEPTVNMADNAIEVYSEAEEWIKIYTIQGDLVLIDKKPKGAWKFPVVPISKTVLIIKGESRWVRETTVN